ncbi:MAG: hypothetical protein KAI17_23905 [Thiotrichaceae bacterium]|nr:hypothetical protein [Thiotrichaceae bacterium]
MAALLSRNDVFLLSDAAICAAYKAGEIVAQHSQLELAVQHKKAGQSLASQVLTEVDLLCQDIILKTLLSSCKKFDIALLSEESNDDKTRLEKEYFWSIDPLDGTLPFIESTSGYAVSIALVSRSGTALIGVIYDPAEQTLYHAIKDSGVFRNKQAWSLQQESGAKKQALTIVSDRSFVELNNYTKIMQEFETIAYELGFSGGVKTIQHGGAAMNACWVLEKAPACYFKFPKPEDGGGSLWDFAATTCLFLEIGAIASDIYGNPLDLNRSDSTFMNHRGVLFSSDGDLAERVMDIYSKFFDF